MRRISEDPDLGDVVVVLLASTLASLRDKLFEDGYESAADLVGDLVDITDDYVARIGCESGPAEDGRARSHPRGC